MIRPAYARVGPPVEVPGRTALALAAFVGLVVGAIGGGLLGGVDLAVNIVTAVGVWRAVTYLGALDQAARAILAERRDDRAVSAW